jgi:hypothetical protein
MNDVNGAGSTGKLGLLDSNNVFFFGIDTKSNLLQLAAILVDTSLILPNHSLSIVPNFDQSQNPSMSFLIFVFLYCRAGLGVHQDESKQIEFMNGVYFLVRLSIYIIFMVL